MKTVFRIISVIVLAAILLFAAGYLRFKTQVDAEVRALRAGAETEPGEVVTAEMLEALPEPVRRYLTYSGVLGKPPVKIASLKQVGRIRQSAEQAWMDFVADEYFSVSPPAFVWSASAPVAGLPLVRVRDRYAGGAGNMWVTVDGLYTMGDARGPEMDQGSLMRYLAEMVWFPSAFLGENVSWQAVDEQSAQVTLVDRGASVTGTMFFDEEGRFTRFESQRYRDAPGGATLEGWYALATGYGTFAGVAVPVRGLCGWHLNGGDFPYIEWEITALEYAPPAP